MDAIHIHIHIHIQTHLGVRPHSGNFPSWKHLFISTHVRTHVHVCTCTPTHPPTPLKCMHIYFQMGPMPKLFWGLFVFLLACARLGETCCRLSHWKPDSILQLQKHSNCLPVFCRAKVSFHTRVPLLLRYYNLITSRRMSPYRGY